MDSRLTRQQLPYNVNENIDTLSLDPESTNTDLDSLIDVRSTFDPSIPIQITDDLQHLIPLNLGLKENMENDMIEQYIENRYADEISQIQPDPSSSTVPLATTETNTETNINTAQDAAPTTNVVCNTNSTRTNRTDIKKKIKADRTSNFLTHRPIGSSPMSTRRIWMPSQLLIDSRNVEWLQVKEIEAIKINDSYIYIIQEIKNLPAHEINATQIYTPLYDTEHIFQQLKIENLKQADALRLPNHNKQLYFIKDCKVNPIPTSN